LNGMIVMQSDKVWTGSLRWEALSLNTWVDFANEGVESYERIREYNKD